MKRLKPGQLCTINCHVFQCKEAKRMLPCDECTRTNKNSCILCTLRTQPDIDKVGCVDIFGLDYYPKLIK